MISTMQLPKKSAGRLLADFQPTVGQQTTDSQPTEQGN